MTVLDSALLICEIKLFNLRKDEKRYFILGVCVHIRTINKACVKLEPTQIPAFLEVLMQGIR